MVITAMTIMMIMAVTSPLVGHAASISPSYFVTQLSNGINRVLSKCGIKPSTISTVIPSSLSPVNNTVSLELSLGNNYTIIIDMKLAGGQLPVSGVDISVINKSNKTCPSISIPINGTVSGYDYTVLKSNYFYVILSYSGPAPTVTNTSNSLVIYGTSINSAIIIPMVVGDVICNTGSPYIPIYMVRISGRPIMYVIQPTRPVTSMLCRYSQSLSDSYLLMAIIISIAAALIYEAVIMIRAGRLKIA